ncbi:MAG: hypothetical protein ABI041_04290, partial [Bdellovibrionia bacterium]
MRDKSPGLPLNLPRAQSPVFKPESSDLNPICFSLAQTTNHDRKWPSLQLLFSTHLNGELSLMAGRTPVTVCGGDVRGIDCGLCPVP